MPLIITGGLGGASPSPDGPSIKTNSYLAYRSKLIFTMNKNVKVDGPAALASSYVIEAFLGGPAPKVQQVKVSNKILTLVTDPQDPLVQYQLVFPAVGITSTVLEPYIGPFTFLYFPTATETASVQIVSVIDARNLLVVFDMPVNDDDASDVSKYSFTPSLTVKAAVKVTDLSYQLTTSRQAEGTNYSLTINGIRGK